MTLLRWLTFLTQMVNFSTQIPDCDSQSPALLDLFPQMLLFVLQWENSNHVVSVSIDFTAN